MRKISAIIGAFMALGIAAMTFLTSGVDVKFFINLLGLAIVIGGSMSAIFLSYSLTDIMRVASIVGGVFLRTDKSFNKIGTELMQFSEKCSNSGVPTNNGGAVHPFLNDCLVMINDGYENDVMREMLEQRIMSTYDMEKYEMNIIRSMSKYPPAFGMIGTVVGLIALMASMGGESADMAQIGAYMAVALTTTLYGLMIANFMFKPISDNLEIGSKDNLKMRQLILETALLIKDGASLLVIQDTINSLIPPREAVNFIGGGSGAKSAA
jgi:chemotaxis protein MotA